MTDTFTSVLDRPSSEIKPPPVLPTGLYLWVIKGLPRYDKAKTGTEFYEFTLGCLQVGDDVDPEQVELIEGGVIGKEFKHRFYLSEAAASMYKDFLLDTLKIDNEDDKSLRALTEDTPGKQFWGAIVHEPRQDGKGVQARIGRNLLPVE